MLHRVEVGYIPDVSEEMERACFSETMVTQHIPTGCKYPEVGSVTIDVKIFVLASSERNDCVISR
jgi:hypothetical protein